MKVINERTVELTDEELVAKERFDEHIAKQRPISLSAKLALSTARIECGCQFSDEFITWLSDGTVIRWGMSYRIVSPR